mgnify:CR=1 FL=1
MTNKIIGEVDMKEVFLKLKKDKYEFAEKNLIEKNISCIFYLNTVFMFEGYGEANTVFRLEVVEIDYFEVKD